MVVAEARLRLSSIFLGLRIIFRLVHRKFIGRSRGIVHRKFIFRKAQWAVIVHRKFTNGDLLLVDQGESLSVRVVFIGGF